MAACRTEHTAPPGPVQEPTPVAVVPPPVERIEPVAAPAPSAPRALEPFEITVPGTTAKLAFVVVPADPADPASRPFFLARTETLWDHYDAFVFATDRAETEKDPPDAFARPSKPYILMDRGFGHAGYPAISTSHKGASEFCRWLTHRTGKRFRLPSDVEWERACRLGASASRPLDEVAWHAGNCAVDGRATTHPPATKLADALGLHDLLGNVAEWTTSAEGTGVARGGSFRDAPEAVNASARLPDDKALNKTDPQRPRSVWWLADGGFIGFRVLCEVDGAR